MSAGDSAGQDAVGSGASVASVPGSPRVQFGPDFDGCRVCGTTSWELAKLAKKRDEEFYEAFLAGFRYALTVKALRPSYESAPAFAQPAFDAWFRRVWGDGQESARSARRSGTPGHG